MIRTKLGEIRIEGDLSEVLADISVISNCLLDTGKLSKKQIIEAVERGFMSEEELDEEIKKITKSKKESLESQIAELFSNFADELRGGKKDE